MVLTDSGGTPGRDHRAGRAVHHAAQQLPSARSPSTKGTNTMRRQATRRTSWTAYGRDRCRRAARPAGCRNSGTAAPPSALPPIVRGLAEGAQGVAKQARHAPVRNAMTIDVEDYFQVSAFAPLHRRAKLAARANAGWRRNIEPHPRHPGQRSGRPRPPSSRWAGSPSAIRRWCAASWPAATSWPATATATSALPTGRAKPSVHGTTSPARKKPCWKTSAASTCWATARHSFSIGTANLWAFDVPARRATATAQRSTPIKHDHYGMPDAPRFAYERREGLLGSADRPPCAWASATLPAGGGGYFRLLPYALSRWHDDAA